MIKTSQINDSHLTNKLAEFYANNALEDAEKVVKSMDKRSTFGFNILMKANLKNKNTHKVFSLFDEMLHESVEPDPYTYTLVLKACTFLALKETTTQLHCQIVKCRIKDSTFVRNKLIHMYAVFGSMSEARKLFDESPELDIITWNSMLKGYAENRDNQSINQIFKSMPHKDVVSWNTIIALYVKIGEFAKAIELFEEMQEKGEKPDGLTMVSVLTAIAYSGALGQGKWVNAYIKKHGIELDGNLGSALVNMYSKCGCLSGAIKAFEETKMKELDTWNSIIGGLASNGKSIEALNFFSKMKNSKIEPNAITFSCVLNACSHGGLVEKGLSFFNEMKCVYGIEPDIAHYGCIVDLLGRAGLLDKVEEIMKYMPMEPDIIMLKALLGACKTHKNFDMGEKIGSRLIELAPNDHASYVLLSNIYAMDNKWDKVHNLRKAMLNRGIRKTPGCSSIEIDGVVHEFILGDSNHDKKKDIYEMLEEMGKKLKAVGYKPDTKEVLQDIEDEQVRETSLRHHSEKLAVAYGLISTKPKTTIRVIKNLRMCGDCHSAFKLLSRIYERELIVRDSNRFHTFREGSCSCGDYW